MKVWVKSQNLRLTIIDILVSKNINAVVYSKQSNFDIEIQDF